MICMAKGLFLSTAAPSTIKQVFANSSAVTRKYVAIVMLALSVALASLTLDIFREFDIVSILCMVLCLACAAIAVMAFQRTLHQELYRDNLARRDVLKIDLLRLVLISALLVVVCLLFGITAVVLQFLLIPIFGFSAVIGILEALAVLLGIMSFPLLATVFFVPIASIAPTAPSTSRSDKAHLHRIQNGIRRLVSLARLDLADIKKAAPIYVPLLIVTTAIFVLGAALHLLLALIPLHILHQILSLVLAVFLGVVWLAAIYRLMYDMVLQGNSFNWLRSLHLQTFIHRLQCVSGKATACMLSFVLVFSMLGMAPAAFAEELEKAASDPGNIADVYEPDQTEREDVQESPAIQTPDTQSESTSNGTDTSVDTTAPKKEVTPKPPQDLYPEDKIEGTPVYMEGEATVLQTSEKTFTTVIGGVDVAFEDERVGSMLLITPSMPNPMDFSPKMLPIPIELIFIRQHCPIRWIHHVVSRSLQKAIRSNSFLKRGTSNTR